MAGARRDRGSVSLWVVIFAAASIVLLVLLVDGGQAMLTKVRVADIAEQGARAAADDVDTGNLRAHGTVTLASGYCTAASTIVTDYLSSAELGTQLPTTCGIPSDPPPDVPELVSVTVSVQVKPILPLIFKTYTVTSTQSATVFCGTADAQEAC